MHIFPFSEFLGIYFGLRFHFDAEVNMTSKWPRQSGKAYTNNSEFHHQDSNQQGFEKMGELNQMVAIYNVLMVPHDHA